jgi:aerobic-type carbon monoxide dehydrogenase small subunit (CoxS/CutS family)
LPLRASTVGTRRHFSRVVRAQLHQLKKKPTDAEIKDALQGLKCRCGTHVSILKAVKRAADMMG